ncbi:MAG: hypothetical protein JO029_12730 [Candidatus Eremiobacteraeota bacterium]|nr:hypothetical protein [Candidatus Eremiobacteraeota bacterium]
MMLALVLSSALAAACEQPEMAFGPPAVLTDALAARHPNGISVDTITLATKANGTVTSVTTDAQGAMQAVVQTWGKSVRYASQDVDCDRTPIVLNGVDFYPPSSGLVGFPHAVAGVDFDNFAYTGGPGNCAKVTLQDGTANDSEGAYQAYVQELFAGTVSGTKVAVVVLRCEYNGHGFDSGAQAFVVRSGKATKAGSLGEGGMASADSAFPGWPGGWIHIAFRDGLLYADVWDRSRACDRNADWVSTAYALRNGKLVALNATRHHRLGLDPACDR